MTDRPRERRTTVAHWAELAALSVLVFLIWYWAIAETSEPYTMGIALRGGVADWLVAKEGLLGANAYAPSDELASKWLDLTGVTPATPHPRPPSAIAALLPLALLPSDAVIVFVALAMAVCLVVTVDLLIRWLQLPPRATWVASLLIGSTSAIAQGAVWGTHIPLVALCCVRVATRPRHTRLRAPSSVLGGIAIGLKLFPALLVLTRARVDRKLVTGAFSVFGLLMLLGLLMPGVSLTGAWAAISGASHAYSGGSFDMTLAAQLGVHDTPLVNLMALAAIGLVPILWKIEDDHEQIAFAFLLMLLASPIAWPEYQLLALPAALLLWKRSIVGKVAAASWFAVLAITLNGSAHLVALLVLAVTLLYERLVKDPTLATSDRAG